MDNAPVQIILLGAPGSGKGTQAKKIASAFGYSHISTGDLLRSEIAKESELGKKINEVVKLGQLVDDATVLELLQKNCDLDANKYIFDGFPRTFEQAKALDEVVLKDSAYIVLYFEMDSNVIINRLVARRVCKQCNQVYNLLTNVPKKDGHCDDCGAEIYQRDDDKKDVIKKRFDVYENTINSVLEYYSDRNVLKKINADNDLEKVFSDISEKLNS